MKNQIVFNPIIMGTYIRKLRETNNYSQYDMASAINISQNTYWHLENGKSSITFERILTLAAIFNLTIIAFIEGYLIAEATFPPAKK
jgi:transcriptional regulator with XRE-family HTH domain